MGNISVEENGKDNEQRSNATDCCLGKTEKLAIPARVVLLQSANIWVGDLGASVHCTNNRHGDNNIHKGSGAGSVGDHRKAMTASSIMDTAGIR